MTMTVTGKRKRTVQSLEERLTGKHLAAGAQPEKEHHSTVDDAYKEPEDGFSLPNADVENDLFVIATTLDIKVHERGFA